MSDIHIDTIKFNILVPQSWSDEEIEKTLEKIVDIKEIARNVIQGHCENISDEIKVQEA